MGSPLDNPAWSALTGPHARFAESYGQVLRYSDDVAPFVALPDNPGEDVWTGIAALSQPGSVIVIPTSESLIPPPGPDASPHAARSSDRPSCRLP